MAGNSKFGPDLFGQSRGVYAAHISDLAIDGQDGDVNSVRAKKLCHAVVDYGVATVVDGPRAGTNDVSEIDVPPAIVLFELLMGGGDRRDVETFLFDGLAGVQRDQRRRVHLDRK